MLLVSFCWLMSVTLRLKTLAFFVLSLPSDSSVHAQLVSIAKHDIIFPALFVFGRPHVTSNLTQAHVFRYIRTPRSVLTVKSTCYVACLFSGFAALVIPMYVDASTVFIGVIRKREKKIVVEVRHSTAEVSQSPFMASWREKRVNQYPHPVQNNARRDRGSTFWPNHF